MSPDERRSTASAGHLTATVRNSLSYFISVAVGIATGFVVMPVVVHGIGLVEFGIWAVGTTIVGYSGLLDLGLGQTLIKNTSASLAKHDAAELERTTCEVFTIYLVAGAVVLVAGCVVAFYGGPLFNIGPEHLGLYRDVVLVLFATAALSLPMSVLNGLIGGLQDLYFLHLYGSALAVIRAVITIALVMWGYGLIAIVLANSAITIVGWIGNYLWVHRRLPELQIAARRITLRFSGIARFTASMSIWTLAGQALQSLDRIIVGLLMTLSAVGIYEIGAKLHWLTRSVINVVQVALPTTSALDAEGRHMELNALYRYGSKLTFGAYGAVVVFFVVFADEFVHLWMGPGFEQSVAVAKILAAATLFQSQNSLGHVTLVGIGNLRVFTSVMAAYPFLLAAFGAALGAAFGLIGVACGVLAAVLVAEGILLAHLHKVMGVTATEWIRQVYLPTAICMCMAGVLGLAIQSIDGLSWGLLMAKAGLVLALYVVLFLAVGIRRQDRNLLFSRLSTALATGRVRD